MLEKGAVPVPYIIALILGIVVIGLLGYWFIVLGGRIPGQAAEASCAQKTNIWCSDWSAQGFSDTARPRFINCTNFFNPLCWDDYAPGCKDIGYTMPDDRRCRELLGLTTTTT